METGDTGITKKEFSAVEKQAMVAGWKQSGQTMMAFSRTIGVNYHTFITWINPKKKTKSLKSGKGKPVSGFSEIPVPLLSNEYLFARAYGKTK